MIVPSCKARPRITLGILHNVIDFSLYFDRLTKTHITEDLYAILSSHDLEQLMTHLIYAFLKLKTPADRKRSADQLIVLLRIQFDLLSAELGQVRKHIIRSPIDFFVRLGFFVKSDRYLEVRNPLTDEDHSILREKLFSALSTVVSDPDEVWASYAVRLLQSLDVVGKGLIKLDKHVKKIWNEAFRSMDTLRAVRFPL
jgi:DNA polymerase phi